MMFVDILAFDDLNNNNLFLMMFVDILAFDDLKNNKPIFDDEDFEQLDFDDLNNNKPTFEDVC